MLGREENINILHSAKLLDNQISEKNLALTFVNESSPNSVPAAINSLNLLLATNNYVIKSGLAEPANQISFFPNSMKEAQLADEFEFFLAKLMQLKSKSIQNELICKICYPCFCHVFIAHPCKDAASRFFMKHSEFFSSNMYPCSICDEIFQWNARHLCGDATTESNVPSEKNDLCRNITLKRVLSVDSYDQLQTLLERNRLHLSSISHLIMQKIQIRVEPQLSPSTENYNNHGTSFNHGSNHNPSSFPELEKKSSNNLNNNVDVKYEYGETELKKENETSSNASCVCNSSVLHPNTILHNLKCDFTSLLCADITGNHIAVGCLDSSLRIMDLYQSKMASSLLSLIHNDASFSQHRSSEIESQFIQDFKKSVQCVMGHDKGVTCVEFAKTWPYVLTGSFDSTCRLWNTKSNECAVKYHGHNFAIHDVSISKDDSYFVSAGTDATCRMWAFDQPLEPLRILCRHEGCVNSVDFHPNGRFVLSGGNDTISVMWDLNKAEHVRLFTEQDAQISAVKFAPNGLYCAIGLYFRYQAQFLLIDTLNCF